MIKKVSRNDARIKRHKRIRNHLSGTSESPRLSVFRSNKYIYAQIIDDTTGHTLVSASSIEEGISSQLENTGNIAAATLVGTTIAQRALANGINTIVFDRGGYLYHGKVKALADAARAAGLKF